VLSRFTWQKVAERHWGYCQAALNPARDAGSPVGIRTAAEQRSIGFVTTWNTKCGIAEYTRYLAASLPLGLRFAIFANRPWEQLVRPDEAYVTRCWEPYTGVRSSEGEIEELSQAILKSGVQAVSIQYNFNFFTPASLKELLQRLKRKRIVTTVTMHAIRHKSFPQLMAVLQETDFCICHRQADVDEIEQSGVKNVLLRQQGIVSSRLDPKNSSSPASCSRFHFVISCFGFFLPLKGIYQLIQAFALAKSVQPMLRLKLLNSLYAVDASTEYAHQCMRLIGEKHLRGDVHVSTVFLDHEETLRELGDSDLVVLPYLARGIFQRRRLRNPSLRRPVLCSDLPLSTNWMYPSSDRQCHRWRTGSCNWLGSGELNRYQEAQEIGAGAAPPSHMISALVRRTDRFL
jgi:glycosyltransferase involved in cell wall biosynthesis